MPPLPWVFVEGVGRGGGVAFVFLGGCFFVFGGVFLFFCWGVFWGVFFLGGGCFGGGVLGGVNDPTIVF